MDLANFFSASEARIDRWRQLNATSRAWEASIAKGKPDDKLHAEAAQIFTEIQPLEDYWAFPGPRLMATISEALEQRNAAVFARLVQKTSNALLTGSYRYESAAWDPLQEGEERAPDILPPDVKPGESHKPYFEVLVVTPNDPKTWERARNELRRLRRPEDLFNYEILQVGSFEDGALGAIFNHNVQAVMIYDGFPYPSKHDLPVMREFLTRNLRIDPTSIAPGVLATTLARAIKAAEAEGLRPKDYHLDRIEAALGEMRQILARNERPDAGRLLALEFLLSDAYLVYSGHLLNGRVNPETLHADEWTI